MQIKLFYVTVFLMFFLSGTNVLYSIHYPKELPPLAFWGIFLLVLSLGIQKLIYYKTELMLIGLLVLVMIFNYITGRDIAVVAYLTAIMCPPFFSYIIEKLKWKIKKNKLQKIIYLFYITNCVLAIFERLTYHCIFPNLGFETGFNEWNDEFRSYSLYGHPLSNGEITLLLMNVILWSNLNMKKKYALWLLGFAALLCFNSRLAILLSILVYIVYIIYNLFCTKERASKKYFYVLNTILGLALILYLFSIGWGNRLVNNDLLDGSASVRIFIWDIFKRQSWVTFLFGQKYSFMEQLMLRNGLSDYIIENCWILFVFRYGILFLGLMVVFYVPLFIKYLKHYSLIARFLIVVPWLIYISSSNSLATGGLSITVLLLVLYTFNDTKNNTLLLAK